jgi:hypothetical protein
MVTTVIVSAGQGAFPPAAPRLRLDRMSGASAEGGAAGQTLKGQLHIYVAHDWGDEVDLEIAARLAPGAARSLARRPRTPESFAYKPAPLRFDLEPVSLALPPICEVRPAIAEATVFDFAAVSVAVRIPFELTPDALSVLAGSLADPGTASRVVTAAREALTPLYHRLLPAVVRPQWDAELWEEYFVFAFPPGRPLRPDSLLGERARWLAGLVRLEGLPLSDDEQAEALRLSLRYGAGDLIVADWAAAALLDDEPGCEETLQTVELANLQLLEYRQIDDRLDRNLARAYRLVHGPVRTRLPLLSSHDTPLRVLGELKVEANGLFERTGNVLKLVGDPYLARVYRLLAARFHLREWERSIQRKLDVIESVYRVVSDQAAAYRSEFLELVVIGLILLEVLLAIFRH